jgi:hypothetical protein
MVYISNIVKAGIVTRAEDEWSILDGKITRPNFFYRLNFSILRKLFTLKILRVQFGHFYSG